MTVGLPQSLLAFHIPNFFQYVFSNSHELNITKNKKW